jgi:ATP-dependent DNA helicase RecG
VYDVPAELLAAIAAGEDSLLELKEIIVEGAKLIVAEEGKAVPWLARQMSAFCNTDGGVLVLGVSDDRRLVGVPDQSVDALQRLVVDAARDGVEPPADHLVRLDAMRLPGNGGATVTVLKVDIRPDYYAVHAPRGRRPYVRAGSTTREVSMEQLPRLLARRSTFLSADERPVLAAAWDDLDHERIEAYHHARFGRPADDLARFAANVKLTELDELGGSHPSVAGLLLFGHAPLVGLPHAGIDLVVYRGNNPDTDQRLDTRHFDGALPNQVGAAMAYLDASPMLSTASSKDASGRVDSPSYSLRALQECVVNAVAHRDYAIAGRVRIQVFASRIDVTSPGRLPNSLTPEDLFAGAQPIRRNQIVVGFLSRPATWPSGRAAMEGMGEGFLTIVRETERLTGSLPQVRQQTEALTISLPARPPAS